MINFFPLLIVSTVDMNKEYHPNGVMLTKTEGTDDYKYMCSRLKELAADELIGATDFNPTVLLADAAPEITNGFKAVFTLGDKIVYLID